MKKIERKLGSLNENQLDVFRKLECCLKAARFCIDKVTETYDKGECKLSTSRDFIKEILLELEDRKFIEMRMFDKIKNDYKLNDDEFRRLEINPDNGDINILTKEYFELSKNGNLDIRKFDLIWG